MGKRAEERAAAAARLAEELKDRVPEELQPFKPRKGGTAKWKKNSKVLVPHTDQVGAAGLCVCAWVAYVRSAAARKGCSSAAWPELESCSHRG